MNRAADDILSPAPRHRAARQLSASALVGMVVGAVSSLFTIWQCAWLIAWASAAVLFQVSVWRRIGRLDPAATRRLATSEDPGRAVSDTVLILAAVSSLFGSALTLVDASHLNGATAAFMAAVAVLAVVVSWATVPTIFTLRYARLYYDHARGVDFHEQDDSPPTYIDFAYVAFTVAMTFQVSDTEITGKEMRATVLRQSLLSYLFGVVIIAATINVVAGFFK